MRVLRTILLATLAAGLIAAGDVYGQTPKSGPTKEERRAERARKIAARATAAARVKVKEGKHPGYNRLLKSTDYMLMYREGLRYYDTKKKDGGNSLSNLRKAQALFQSAINSQGLYGTPQADSLYYYYGCSFFKANDFAESQDIFDKFRREYAASPFVEDAEYKFAMGFYLLAPNPKHDQSITVRAISAISEYLGRYPETTHREVCDQAMLELRRKLYAKSFENARLYYDIGQYKAAVRALSNAIDEYPTSPYREELMYLATRSAWLLARNSITSMMTDRYMAMMDNYYNLISEFPETRHLREVEQMRNEARKHIETNSPDKIAGGDTTKNDGNN